MNQSGRSLSAFAVLCGVSACSSEVTLHLFEHGTASAGTSEDAGDGSTEPCHQVGAELCNGVDDDCNGVVDDGCIYTVDWTPQPDGTSLGHAGGGVSFSEPCPDGSLLTGMRVVFGQSLDQVSAACSPIDVRASADADASFSIALGPRFNKPFAPATNADPNSQLSNLFCPDGLVAATLEGDDDPSQHIVAVRIRCAPLTVSPQGADRVLDVDHSQEQAVGPVACATCPPTPTFNFEGPVPPQQVAKRLFGGVGTLVNRVGFGTSVAIVGKR